MTYNVFGGTLNLNQSSSVVTGSNVDSCGAKCWRTANVRRAVMIAVAPRCCRRRTGRTSRLAARTGRRRGQPCVRYATVSVPFARWRDITGRFVEFWLDVIGAWLLGETDQPSSKTPTSNQYSLAAPQPSERSSINTNRKSTTSFPTSLGWTEYVAHKPPKGLKTPCFQNLNNNLPQNGTR